jgi:hypothetical protein
MDKMKLIHLLHIFIFAGLLLYIFVKNKNMPQSMNIFLIILGIIVIIYQTYKYILTSYTIYLFHLLVIAPILIYIGYFRPEKDSFVYELVLMLIFATIGYHGYYLLI